jgi:hypothetical protein
VVHPGSGDLTVVAAQTRSDGTPAIIRVVAAFLVVSGAGVTTFTWKSSGGSTLIPASGAAILSQHKWLPRCAEGWFETPAGEALVLNGSAATTINGFVVWERV